MHSAKFQASLKYDYFTKTASFEFQILPPFGRKSFNQAISLGKKGYPLLNNEGEPFGRVWLKSESGVVVAAGQVSEQIHDSDHVELLYAPIKVTECSQNNIEYQEVKVLAFRALETKRQIDEQAITDALAAIRETVRSSVSCVYFVKPEKHDVVKIGFSVDPVKRLDQLATGSFDKLVLLHSIGGTRRLEAALHKAFAAHRVNREWFALNDTLLEFMKGIGFGVTNGR